jgi:hypothetical protein
VGPARHPRARVVPDTDSTALPPPSPSRARFPVRGPHAKAARPALISRPPPLDVPTRAALPSCAAATGTLTLGFRRRILAAAIASSSRSTPKDAQGGEEPAGVACRRPRASHRPQLLAGAPPLPEPHRRFVCRLRRVPATSVAPDGFVVPCAASRCFPRTESSLGTLYRVSPVSPPPFTAGPRRRLTHPPPRRLLASRAVGSRSDASDRIPPSLKPASHRSHQI